jgi:hypothetical protein
MKLFGMILSIVKAPYLFLKERRLKKEAKKKRKQLNRRCRTDTISALMKACEFGGKTIAELRNENARLRARLSAIDVDIQNDDRLIYESAVKLTVAATVKQVDDRQKVVLGMELREAKNELEIANGKIEFLKGLLEIYRE